VTRAGSDRTGAPPLSVGFSAFLDVVRFGAAVIVFLSHFGTQAISHSVFYVFDPFSHSAVIVFFVLSGYVIAYVTEERERDGLAYAVSRVSRIYSVVVPAIALTIALDLFGRSINPGLYHAYSYFSTRYGLLEVLSSLFFLNESWPTRVDLFSNTAYWSLNYEIWFYIFFGVLLFCRGWLKYAVLLLLSPFVAARIYLLAPVWLLGVWVRRQEGNWTPPRALGVPVLCLCAVAVLGGDWLRHVGWWPWALSPWVQEFVPLPLWDYVTGLLVATAFLAGSAWTNAWVPGPTLLAIIRWLAGMTFTIYLVHRPLLLFLAAALPGPPESNVKRVAILAISAVFLVILSYVTERQKDRLRAALTRLVAVLQQRKIARRLRPG
jgi:peptidoglycan/LPS O-acetylase OafA/YrhL